jgi:hypothetical protein
MEIQLVEKLTATGVNTWKGRIWAGSMASSKCPTLLPALEDRGGHALGILATYQEFTFGMGALVPRPISSWGGHEDCVLLPLEAMSPMCTVLETDSRATYNISGTISTILISESFFGRRGRRPKGDPTTFNHTDVQAHD